MSVIVRIVNTEAKYSLDALSGDEWEVRRTKQILRAVLRAKNEMNVTTEQLAQSCSRFMGAPDSVKTATLNGMFAGKRKSISMSEVEMFAKVLHQPVLDILYPAGEKVEVSPGRFASSADALADAVLPPLFSATVRFGGRAEAIIQILRRAGWLENATARAIWSLRRMSSQAPDRIRDVKYHLEAFHTEYFTMEALDNQQAITLPSTVHWALDTFDPQQITPSFLLELEPLFEGQAVGDYWFGRSNDEHQEET